VRPPIRFDDDFPSEANEVREIGPDRRLPTKAMPDLMISKRTPKQGFRVRHIATMRPRELREDRRKRGGSSISASYHNRA
jgi:hypothetical protein